MALITMTAKEQDLTVKNVLVACKDINKLNKRGYNFLYLASGFMAHYSLSGFKDYYSGHALTEDIKVFANYNQYRNFSRNDRDYDYMMAKKDVYNRIVEVLK